MTEPTDVELEAMAEKLWDAFQSVIAPDSPKPWALVVKYGEHIQGPWRDRNVLSFRAMARVALQPEENGDEVRG